MIDGSLHYVLAVDQGDGYDEYIEDDSSDYSQQFDSLPVINTMQSMSSVEELPMFYTEQELDEMQRESEAYERSVDQARIATLRGMLRDLLTRSP